MKVKELRHKSEAELKIMLGEHRSKLYNFRMNKTNAQLKNVKEIDSYRKDISKMLTIIKEKDITK